jgi:hypothetical protein
MQQSFCHHKEKETDYHERFFCFRKEDAIGGQELVVPGDLIFLSLLQDKYLIRNLDDSG